MELPPIDLEWFAENLEEVVSEIVDAWNSNGTVAATDEAPPELLRHAMAQLANILGSEDPRENSTSPNHHEMGAQDISELGEYGLTMLGELALLATDLGLSNAAERLEQVALSLALWVTRQGGKLKSAELAVNGLARLANYSRHQADLTRLFGVMSDVLAAIPKSVREGETRSENENVYDVRRILLLNRAIVATRALSPKLMDWAFSDVARELPDSAADFFSEGKEQVGIQEYPPEVSEVIERFHRDWPKTRVLH